jgi:3-oxoacyl-[acyl-carrier protein] reductase
MNHIDLGGRRAVITGGSSGIGFAAAQRFVESGATVALWDIHEAGLAQAARKLVGVSTYCVDITNEDAVSRVTQQTASDLGSIDILVNSAGIAGEQHPVTEFPLLAWQRIIDINLTGTFICCKAVVPVMRRFDYGRIVNMSSTAGKDGNATVSAYSASKAGVMALTKSLGKELAGTGIRVNCVTPAMIETELVSTMSPERIRTALSRIPMGRAGKPEEVAAMIAWLASEDCSFSTGGVFDISGGRSTY